MPSGELHLAVDAGGTKTAAWLIDTSHSLPDGIVGKGRSSAGNPLSVGIAASTHAIGNAIREARANAACGENRVGRIILSVAGAANGEIAAQYVAWVKQAGLADRVAIVSDVLPVLAAGTAKCCGVALVSGTGSVAFARSADGLCALCGGWGYLLGDEGSGYSIGRDALHLVLKTLESRGVSKPLVESLLRALNVKVVTELTRKIYNEADTRRAIASYAPLVIQAADSGDADAQAIVDTAANDLANLVKRAFESVELGSGPVPLALGGGVLAASQRLREQLAVELRRHGLEVETTVVDEPLVGCVRLATMPGNLVNWHDA